MSSKRILVTAALPYANGYIHLGHCAGAYLPADLYVRFLRMNGQEVLFVCGSDEHGAAISISAEKEKTTPQAIIDKYHTANAAAFRRFGMSFDVYSRTSLPIHYRTSQEFFLDLYNKGYFAEKEEEQFYDADARMFLPDRFVEGTCPNCGYDKARGDQCDRCGAYYNQLDLKEPRSLVSGKTPVVKRTKHWYFRLGEFQKPLEEYIASHAEWKDNVLRQAQSWLKQGLGDRAITRDLDWGIPVPLEDAKGKVIYVWFDAPIGYISATKVWAEEQGTPDAWKQWWQDEGTRYIAFIGKDNIVFHTLIFPAMLMAKGGYILPDNVPGNEFLNLEGEKFSKSRNWGIDLKEYLEEFPEDQHVDALRYALAMALPETRDSDFTWKDFQARVNNELASKLGNFVNRSMQFLLTKFDGRVPVLPGKYSKLPEAWKLLTADILHAVDCDAEELFEDLAPKYLHYFAKEDVRLIIALVQGAHIIAAKYNAFRLRDAVNETMNLAQAANKYFNDTAPWKTIKDNPEECARALYICAQAVRSLGVAFAPILPFASEKMLAMVAAGADRRWATIGQALVPEGTNVTVSADKLFTHITDEQVQRQAARLGAGAQQQKPEGKTKEETSGLITIDDVKKVALRTARITAAERVPKSEKLLKLQVDLGGEQRQIVAGIGKWYTPETLIGRTVVVVANLQPARLMGIESQGMLLAANTPDGGLALIGPDADVAPGVEVR